MRKPQQFTNVLSIVLLLYGFLLSISLLSGAFKLLGKEFAESLFAHTENPFVGLFVGILATALVQSSSFTTSLVVGLVSAGTLGVQAAVPLIMGANIGTTVTNTLVSMGHLTRDEEFERAFAGATVHDFFNFMLVLFFLPLEIATGFLRKTATWATQLLHGSSSGAEFTSPVKVITKPVVKWCEHFLTGDTSIMQLSPQIAAIVLIVVSLGLLFLCLSGLVKVLRATLTSTVENVIDRFVTRSPLFGILLGFAVTFLVQSSSITTSFMIPLIAANLVQLQQVFYITMGANIGTTFTSILASLAADRPEALTIALVHFLFNVSGMVIFLAVPALRVLPPRMATRFASMAVKSKRYALVYVLGIFFGLPLVMVLVYNMIKGI